MDIKIICKRENYETYEKMLISAGFNVSSSAKLTFKEDDYEQDTFIGNDKGKFELVHYSKILYFESYGHEIIMNTLTKEYLIREKLYEVEGLLSNKGFIRINKSTVVNKFTIKEIIPTINSRLYLNMKNNKQLVVTRSYSLAFKEFIGF